MKLKSRIVPALMKLCIFVNVLVCSFAVVIQSGELFMLGISSGVLCFIGLKANKE